jgi:hypothetical protein
MPNAPSEEDQAKHLADLLTGEQLLTLEPAAERLFVRIGDERVHRSKVLAWWRRGWIEVEDEIVLKGYPGSEYGRARKRLWSLTSIGRKAVKGAES